MIGSVLGGVVDVCKVYLTNRDEVGSLDHTCINVHTTKQGNTSNKEKEKVNQALTKVTLDLDNS